MTERELMIKCIPQITEMALEIKKMTPEQYLKFKMCHLEDVKMANPFALGLIQKIYGVIEWGIYGEDAQMRGIGKRRHMLGKKQV